MKVTIRERVPAARLPDAVPPAYREGLAALSLPEGTYALLLFAHDRRDVVPSSAVRRALRRLGTPAPDGVIAVGTVFTDEALALLETVRARPLTLHRLRWTDEDARQRQL